MSSRGSDCRHHRRLHLKLLLDAVVPDEHHPHPTVPDELLPNGHILSCTTSTTARRTTSTYPLDQDCVHHLDFTPKNISLPFARSAPAGLLGTKECLNTTLVFSSLEKQHQLGMQIHQYMCMHLIGGEILHGYPRNEPRTIKCFHNLALVMMHYFVKCGVYSRRQQRDWKP
uniref:Uncharacterized protein n=1 Tax=Triticum urartu TaxID=4572 RepID=A0A8R7QHI8_TRIUA